MCNAKDKLESKDLILERDGWCLGVKECLYMNPDSRLEEPSSCALYRVCPRFRRPQKHFSIHVMTCLFVSLLKPLSHTKTRTQSQRLQPGWIVLCGASSQLNTQMFTECVLSCFRTETVKWRACSPPTDVRLSICYKSFASTLNWNAWYIQQKQNNKCLKQISFTLCRLISGHEIGS